MDLFQFAKEIVSEAEHVAGTAVDITAVLPTLRNLSLEDFGLLLISMPNAEYPNLSRLLPRMADPDIQRRWTGSSGVDLFAQTAAFARQLETIFVRQKGRPLDGVAVLDFGVGYGRNLRSMLYFTDPANIYGVDAWQGSLNLSLKDRVPGTLRKSEALSDTLPIPDKAVDLIFAFSIFTHISRETVEASLKGMRKAIRPDGLAVVTIRPVEFWTILGHRLDALTTKKMIERHNRDGFAFTPLKTSEDGTYGDASMNMDFLNREGWKVIGYDSSIVDRYQIAAILRPV